MLFRSGKQFWDYVFTTVVYLINRLPTASLNFDILFVSLFNKDPDFQFLKTFGCACFPLLRPYHAHKLDFRSQECLFLGYSSSHKGYRCLSPGKIYISKDVFFNELRFPYFDLFPSFSNSVKNLDSYFTINPNLSPPSIVTTPKLSQPSPSHSTSTPLVLPGFSNNPIHSPTIPLPESHSLTPSECTSVHPQTLESTTINKSSSKSPSAPSSIPTNTHPMQTRFKFGIQNPRLHPSLFLTHSKPKTMKQALENADWRVAMQQEYDALLKNKT